MTETPPALIHTFWDGPPKPEQFRLFPTRWQELNPGWKVQEWNEKSYLWRFGDRDTYDYLDARAWGNTAGSNRWQWFTDIARLEIVYRYGGFWVDADLEPLKPLEPLLKEMAEYGCTAVTAREDAHWVNNAFFGATPWHPLLRDLVDGIPRRVETMRGHRANRVTGPGYWTEVVGRHKGVLVLPSAKIHPFKWNELHKRFDEFPDALTRHHWNNRTSGAGRRRG